MHYIYTCSTLEVACRIMNLAVAKDEVGGESALVWIYARGKNLCNHILPLYDKLLLLIC